MVGNSSTQESVRGAILTRPSSMVSLSITSLPSSIASQPPAAATTYQYPLRQPVPDGHLRAHLPPDSNYYPPPPKKKCQHNFLGPTVFFSECTISICIFDKLIYITLIFLNVFAPIRLKSRIHLPTPEISISRVNTLRC